jgi:CheY-like chemotaxis protein
MNAPRLLVASESVDDAELVRDLLRADYPSVDISCAANTAAEDFERIRPQVILLAFETLEKAKRYCAALDPASTHRTIVLCTRNELHDAYALCRARSFDDYVLFWPMNHDAPRLLMAVHHALLFIGLADASAAAAAADALLRDGEEGMAQAGHSVERADAEIKKALDTFGATPQGQESIRGRLERMHREMIAPHMKEASGRIAAARQSLSTGRAAHASRAALRPPPALAGRERPSVLVVDDDEMQCRLISQALAAVHIQARCCLFGQEALSALRERRPDVILMDIDLPDIDGIELTRSIRSIPDYAKVPVVMITGHSDKQAVIGSLGAGAAGFLVKPLTRQKLYEQINAVLGWKAAPTQFKAELAGPSADDRDRTLSELA